MVDIKKESIIITLPTINIKKGLQMPNLLHQHGKLDEAQAMFVRALRGYELGPDHTSTLRTVNNLGEGELLKQQGKLEEAQAMYYRALRGYEKTGYEKKTDALVSGWTAVLSSPGPHTDTGVGRVADFCHPFFRG